MAVTKTITISGIEVPFKASAALPRLYRLRFRKDIFVELSKLKEAVDKTNSEASTLAVDNLEVFENIAYTMAKHADPDIPNNINDWLEQFETFSIYEILPELLELWGLNTETMSEPKKKI